MLSIKYNIHQNKAWLVKINELYVIDDNGTSTYK